MAQPQNNSEDRFCIECRKTMKRNQFYYSNNLDKYPDGVMNSCKKCLTLLVDNWDPKTYLWILEEADVPYVPNEWDSLLASYGKDPAKVNGTSIIGRYLSKMKLKQYQDFRWRDSEYLQELQKKKIKESMEKQGYGAAEIDNVLGTLMEIPAEAPPKPEPPQVEVATSGAASSQASQDNTVNLLGFDEDDPDNPAKDLTEEDRRYLRLKWGRAYRPDEWVEMENLYQNMRESYDIHTAAHLDTLKLICKTSLKANQMLDMGDIDGAQKAIRQYDALMKSGKFTEAQNKKDSNDVIDSVAELVAMCEQDGFIPRYYTDGPQDKVDQVILDTQHYLNKLVTEELGLGNLIENAIKQLDEEKEREKRAEEQGDDLPEDLFVYEDDKEENSLADADFEAFNAMLEEEAQKDADLMKEQEEE